MLHYDFLLPCDQLGDFEFVDELELELEWLAPFFIEWLGA